MSTKVIMPQMGESIFEGTITKWLKKVGESVDRDEPLFEISTDKVDSEIPAPAAGILEEIVVPEGETVQINTVVAMIGEGKQEEAADAEIIPSPVEEAPVEKAAAEEAKAPDEPQEVEKPAPPPPPVKEEPPATPQGVEEAAPKTSIRAKDIRTSPLVRRLARQHKIDLSKIEGTGLSGRITKQDIQSYLDRSAEAPVPEAKPSVPEQPPTPIAAAPSPAPMPPPDSAPKEVEALRFQGESETVAMTTMRKYIAEPW